MSSNLPCLIHPVRGFETIITEILVNHIHKNTVMSDEHIVSLQIRMKSHPTLMPIIVLQRFEEQWPPLREVMLSAMCPCADKRIISSYSEDSYGQKNNVF